MRRLYRLDANQTGCHSGIALRARPGIHGHEPLEYGFRARGLAAPRNDDLSIGGGGSGYWGAQDKSVPINSGSRPGAPLGGHSTKVPLPEDPVAVAVPAVEVDPPPPPRLAPTPPPPAVWPEAPEPVLLLPPAPVVPVVELVVVVPAAGVEVV